MLVRKFITSFPNMYQILGRTVTMNPSSLAVLGKSCHINNVNIIVFCMKRYCTGYDRQTEAETTLTKNKISITEEEKIMMQEWIESLKIEGMKVPKRISDDQYLHLYREKTISLKKKYLKFLVLKEALPVKDKLQKEQKRALKLEQLKERKNLPQGHIKYGLWKNAMFIKTYKKQVIDLYHHRLASAMIYGQPLVIDLGFEEHLVGRELNSYARQLSETILFNRFSDEPFNLTFCNTNFESYGFQRLVKYMPWVIRPNFPMNITSQSYLEMFPKEKIVYLSPHAEDELIEFDHNAIYIIGGIVDLGEQTPFTLVKAEKENIKVQKLPLDRYHRFKGSKCLPINIVVAILSDVQRNGDWKNAFRFIPKRLIADSDKSHKPYDYFKLSRPW